MTAYEEWREGRVQCLRCGAKGVVGHMRGEDQSVYVITWSPGWLERWEAATPPSSCARCAAGGDKKALQGVWRANVARASRRRRRR